MAVTFHAPGDIHTISTVLEGFQQVEDIYLTGAGKLYDFDVRWI